LQFACNANIADKDVCTVDDLGYTAGSQISGIFIKKVTFKSAVKANPIYPSNNELDFLICFRFEKYSTFNAKNSFTLTSQGYWASSQLLNVNLITHYGTDSIFRWGFVNYYSVGISTNYKYLP